MYRFHVHSDAKADLEKIRETDPETAADLLVFLQELQGDQDLLDRLSQHGYSTEASDWVENIDVQRIQSLWRRGLNLWRLKLWDLEREGLKYRVVYAFVPKGRVYHVLAIVARTDFNYELDHPVTQRVLTALADL